MLHGDWAYVLVGYALVAASVTAYVVRLWSRAKKAAALARMLRDPE